MKRKTQTAPPSPAVAAGKWHLPLALVLVFAVTVLVYWPALRNEFVDFDDDVYVTVNMAVRQGLTLKGFLWAFGAFHAGNWHPLTWLSHMLDIQLFSLNPAGHHATSLLIHALNAVLLCALLQRLTGFLGRSLVVALLFALHPLHVESVAWVSERKDVLSTLFWLLTLWAWAAYGKRPCLMRYLAVASLLALGLMAKQMLVTVPVVLLLLDFWPLRRFACTLPESDGNGERRGIRFLLAEKIPLLLLCGAAAAVTVKAQHAAGAIARGDGQSLLLCAGNALISYVIYLRNTVWPADLALFYPFDPAAVTAVKVASAALLLAAVSLAVLRQRKTRPYLLFGWGWYLVTLLPVIGFLRVGSQALADRYTYVPLIGIFLMIAWGGAELALKWRIKPAAVAGVTVTVLALLSALTVKQIRYWQNSYDLFAHALAVVDGNWLAHNNLGIWLSQHNRNGEALSHFQESVRLNPKGSEGFRNLGNSLQMAGRNPEAIDAFNQALWLNPRDPENHYRLGYAYLLAGNAELAYQQYNQLLSLDEQYATQLLASIRIVTKQ